MLRRWTLSRPSLVLTYAHEDGMGMDVAQVDLVPALLGLHHVEVAKALAQPEDVVATGDEAVSGAAGSGHGAANR